MNTVLASGPIPCAAILAGGKALRMGEDKAGLPLGGIPMIQWVWAQVSPVSRRTIVVGGRPHLGHLGVDTVRDRYPDAGSLGGIATALESARDAAGKDTWVLCVGCDMPFLDSRVVGRLWELRQGWDVVVPRGELGFEPLCALYHTRCLGVAADQLRAGNRRIRGLFREVRARPVPTGELRCIDPELRSFVNVNRPQDLRAAELSILGAA